MILSNGIILLALLLIIFLILGRREQVRHEKNLNLVPVRISVNGTRGKSSVTRLIGAGLKAGNFRVLAKTTGTKPRMIFENSTEVPVIRLGKANIIEQVAVMRRAAKEGVNAVVFENMSLRPDLQWIEETRMVRPGVVVITNVRADHLDVMGPTLLDIARHFINAVPAGSVVITAETEYAAAMEKLCARKRIRLIRSHADDVSLEEAGRFDYLEHRENVALALAVCRHFGIDRERALAGIYRSIPDPGVLRKYRLRVQGKRVVLCNALAANDPDSTYLIYERLEKTEPHTYVLVNCRRDRIDRSLQLGAMLGRKMDAKLYFATGGNTGPLVKKMAAAGVARSKIVDLGDRRVDEVYEEISRRIDDGALIFAIGNIVGYGESLIEYFRQKAGE